MRPLLTWVTVLLAAGLLSGVAPSSADTALPLCFGRSATIVGTEGADEMFGTREADVIAALAGEDHIVGRAGDDYICAGNNPFIGPPPIEETHFDRVNGGRGNDVIDGGPGMDEIHGGPDNDRLVTGGLGMRFWGRSWRRPPGRLPVG